MLDTKNLKTWGSYDLYNSALHSIADDSFEASNRRRYIIMLLNERGESDYIYSIAVNLA